MKNALRITSGRILRFIGTLCKAFSYAFHFALPHMRFHLPGHADAILKTPPGATSHGIPRVLWQTNYTDKVTLPVYLNYLVNRLMSRDFTYRFMTTEARARYIKQHFPNEIFDCYCQLQIGAAQADLWRLLVLYREGGVYMDIDAHAVWPLSAITGHHEKLFILARNGKLTNYFLAAQPNDSDIGKAIDEVVKNIRENRINGVFDMTGPGAINQAISPQEVPAIPNKAACIQGTFTNEYFQYIDKAEGKWTRQQKTTRVVNR
ncbi:glycosyltransferase family 32 protein [Halomonas huangheensis]|uniref:Glycosyl transferase n=1 Tax=Halomonas huangheensis TaxID=1178482 RepID=W1N6Q1_9GAMM|nr:glycosyltransferase [Halomonas huangheensis]ALM51045.1 glycosyl transferase [Halomonas huangheensis]ERL51203.1 hypothetical protein BJB45_14980 [Halomonas huangheensis]